MDECYIYQQQAAPLLWPNVIFIWGRTLLPLGVLTVWSWVWNQKQTHTGSRSCQWFAEQWNRLAGYWFCTCRYDCLWPGQPNRAQLCFENWGVNIHLCSQISASRAFKEVWGIQELVFSSELSVRKSVSDLYISLYIIFILCLGRGIKLLSQYYFVSKRHLCHCYFQYQCWSGTLFN
jgi:hypothetical protein